MARSRSTLKIASNDNSKAGRLAGKKVLFGDFSRYAIFPVHVRIGDRVMWMVEDAETPSVDGTGLPEIIRQAWTREEALRGFESEIGAR